MNEFIFSGQNKGRKREALYAIGCRCKACRNELKQTKRSLSGQGPLAELRCPKCKVLSYIERKRVTR